MILSTGSALVNYCDNEKEKTLSKARDGKFFSSLLCNGLKGTKELALYYVSFLVTLLDII